MLLRCAEPVPWKRYLPCWRTTRRVSGVRRWAPDTASTRVTRFGVPMSDMKRIGSQFDRSHGSPRSCGTPAGTRRASWPPCSTIRARDRGADGSLVRGLRQLGDLRHRLLQPLRPRAPRVARRSSMVSRREEFVKRAAFALLWSLALHDKTAHDERFVAALDLVEREATDDDRPLVTKGIRMALRAVGKRNPELRAAVTASATRLAELESPPAGRSAEARCASSAANPLRRLDMGLRLRRIPNVSGERHRGVMTILITGGTGKTGGRVADRLTTLGHSFRAVTRHSEPRFDWHDESTWEDAITGCTSAYLCFQPDIGLPGADVILGAFTRRAVDLGCTRLVLLSGRGEDSAPARRGGVHRGRRRLDDLAFGVLLPELQ